VCELSWEGQHGFKFQSAYNAIRKHVNPGDRVYCPGICEPADILIEALAEESPHIPGLTVHIANPLGDRIDRLFEACKLGHLRVVTFFAGKRGRESYREGHTDILSSNLSIIPFLYSDKGPCRPDVILVQVSPPDANGYVSLSTGTGMAITPVRKCPTVIAQVNEYVPYCYGDTLVHLNRFRALVKADYPLPSYSPSLMNDAVMSIGRFISGIIPDNPILQIGLGSIPDAILSQLSCESVSIRTELFCDGVKKLFIDGKVKGKIVSGMVVGTTGDQDLYQWVHENLDVTLLPTEQINNYCMISSQKNVVAINSAILVDVTGQIYSDSVGTNIHSGAGGQLDFEYATAYSDGGLPIIALTATSNVKGQKTSRIVVTPPVGTGVVTPRSCGVVVVTENGIADLRGKSVRERAELLLAISDPEFQDDLETEAKKVGYLK